MSVGDFGLLFYNARWYDPRWTECTGKQQWKLLPAGDSDSLVREGASHHSKGRGPG